MRKYKSAYLKPYIRKIKPSDVNNKNCSMDVYIKLGLWEEGFERLKYIMIQRGTDSIMMVGNSKQEIKKSLLSVRKNRGFNKWRNWIKNYCQKK